MARGQWHPKLFGARRQNYRVYAQHAALGRYAMGVESMMRVATLMVWTRNAIGCTLLERPILQQRIRATRREDIRYNSM